MTATTRSFIFGLITGVVLMAVVVAVAAAATPPSASERAIPVASQGRTGAPQSVGDGDRSERRAYASAAAPCVPGPSSGCARLGGGVPLRGIASWYGATGLIAAAGPGLRVGHWRGKIVETCLANRPTVCVRVKLSDWCACPKRLIDLGDEAFRRLAPLSVGLVRVSVEGLR